MANYRRNHKSSDEIASTRSMLINDPAERALFMRTFYRVRKVAPTLAATPMDLETVCEMTLRSSVMEAAMIEALAGLRAEGAQL